MILAIFLLAGILLMAGGAGLVGAMGLVPTDLGFMYFQSGTMALCAGAIVLALGLAVKTLERSFSRLATPAAIRVAPLGPVVAAETAVSNAPAGLAMAGAAAGALAATTYAAGNAAAEGATAEGMEPMAAPALVAPEELMESFERDLFTGIGTGPVPEPEPLAGLAPPTNLRQDPPLSIPPFAMLDTMPEDTSLATSGMGASGLVDAGIAEIQAAEAAVKDSLAGSYALPGDPLAGDELAGQERPKIELPKIELPRIEPFELAPPAHEAVRSDIGKRNASGRKDASKPPAREPMVEPEPVPEPVLAAEPAPVPGLIDDADLAAVSDDSLPQLAPISSLEIVGSYDSAGTRFTMYSDGSVIAAGPQGERRFRSLDELRSHLDTGIASG